MQEQCRNPAVRAAALCSLLQAAPRQQLCPEVLCSSQNRAFKVSKWCRLVITRISLWALRITCFHNRWDKAYCHLQDWLCCGAGAPRGLGWDVRGKLGIPISRIKACAPLEDLMAFDLSGGVSCHWVPLEKQELTYFTCKSPRCKHLWVLIGVSWLWKAVSCENVTIRGRNNF